jgi:outer membrane protein assembly factor BamE (lipoprotein component of BamABCDE complex)
MLDRILPPEYNFSHEPDRPQNQWPTLIGGIAHLGKQTTTEKTNAMKTNITTFRYIALVLACVTLSVGCASTRSGTDFNSANVSKLKVGETTEQEVIQLIGQPHNRTRSSDGTVVLSYMYKPGQTITPFSGFDPNLYQKGREIKMLWVILDANGKVNSFRESSSQ